jgi:hypothetical protein
MTTALVVLALALVCLLAFFIIETRPKKILSMLDLAEFKDLPIELRTIIKSMTPNSAILKKEWANMHPHQKEMIIKQMTSHIPRGPQIQKDNRPPAPSYVIKHTESDSEDDEPPPSRENEVPKSGLKPGFLLANSVDKSQKKNPKNKKKNKVVTFSDVGPSEDEESVPADPTDITDV